MSKEDSLEVPEDINDFPKPIVIKDYGTETTMRLSYMTMFCLAVSIVSFAMSLFQFRVDPDVIQLVEIRKAFHTSLIEDRVKQDERGFRHIRLNDEDCRLFELTAGCSGLYRIYSQETETSYRVYVSKVDPRNYPKKLE